MTSEMLEGGCGCGKVRYRLNDEPMFVNNCHCRLCQRQTGTGSAVNAFIETDRMEHLSGAITEHGFPTGSGGTQTIVRCAECGTAVWSYYPRLERKVASVRVGTLDNPSAVRPDAAIFVADKPQWAPLPDGVRRFDAFYSPGEIAQLLPPERLARLMALIER